MKPFPETERGRTAALMAVTFLLLGISAGARGDERRLVTVRYRDPADVRAMAAAGLDVAGVNRREGTAGVVTDGQGLEKIRAMGLGYAVEAMEAPGFAPAALADYTDPAEMEAFVDAVTAAHPHIARKVVLAEGLHEGHTLYAVRITRDAALENDRPAFILDAQHHAREVMTAEIARDMIDQLTSLYGTDPEVTRWVDNIDIWVVPCVNPDGAAHVFSHDPWWRKNRNPDCPEDPASAGVDLNRNYGWSWGRCGGSSGDCRAETYRGPAPESEAETRGMTALMAGVRAVFALSYHSYGEYILYPLGCADPAEAAAYDALARRLNALLEDDRGLTGTYEVGPGYTLYPIDGSSDDEAYGRWGTYAFTIEVNSAGFQPEYAAWRDLTVARQRAAWKFFLDRTLRTPSIQGHVADASTGLPLQASFRVEGIEFAQGEEPRRADENGRYFWLGEAGKAYRITFSHPGYASRTFRVDVGRGVSWLDAGLETGEAYRITAVDRRHSPFRLVVRGTGFQPGCRVRIDGVEVPATAYLGPHRLVAGSGPSLKEMLPRGLPVAISVEDPAGGRSLPFPFVR